jgi:uncharacterized protein (TIGR02145 family)
MKNFFFYLLLFSSLISVAQTQQNINKNSGTVSNAITEIDSIRFNATNQMVVVTTSGNESHALTDITNVTFSNGANLTPCSGDITSVTDIDGNTYPVAQIGNQCWIAENLRTTKYNNGSLIPNVTDGQAWSIATTPAWCHYENNPLYDATYGKLYNWYTVAGGNMCPTDWHVPTDAELTTLINFLGGESVAGGKMKTTTGWNPPNTAATNESGFSGLPGGFFNGISFNYIGNIGHWWSSAEFNADVVWDINLGHTYGTAFSNTNLKLLGFSVRCLRD